MEIQRSVWCRLRRTFFQLSDKYIEKKTYEELFLLTYHGKYSLREVYNLPIKLREWFLLRLSEQIKEEREEMEKSSRSKRSSTNSPKIR